MATFIEAFQQAERTPHLLEDLNRALGAGQGTNHYAISQLREVCGVSELEAREAGQRLRFALRTMTGTIADQARQVILAFPLNEKAREAITATVEPSADDAVPPPQPLPR